MKNELYIRPSDARSWLHCKRRVWYDNFPPEDLKEVEPDPFDELIVQLGIKHEINIKHDLEQEFQLVEATSVEHTKELMNAGVDIIYQAQIADRQNKIIGEPDFLIRHESGEYQPADAKLARSGEKKEIQIQLGVYRKLMNSTLPAMIFLGDKTTVETGGEANAEADKFLADMPKLLDQRKPPEARYGNSKCKVCPYNSLCKPEFEAKEELTLLYGIDSRSAPHLEAQGVNTISKLAEIQPEDIEDVPYLKGIHKKHKAVLQAKAYITGDIFKIKSPTLPEGTWIHFDIEVNPLTDDGEEHVYLWGFLKPPFDESSFDYVWTDHESEDKQGWLKFLELMEQYKREYPDLVLCHFSSYEVVNIRRYAKRYNMEENPIVEWLLGDNSPLFDIQPMVKNSFVLPLESYGLKQICKHKDLVNFQWQDDDSGSQWSVVQFVKYRTELIKERREQMKKDILTYNFDDVVATRRLEEWLRKEGIKS
jgi:uncharacterized protein